MKHTDLFLAGGGLEKITIPTKSGSTPGTKSNQLAATTKGALAVWGDGQWVEFGNEQPLYAFTTHTFTTASTTGRTGPTQAACVSAYSAAPWASNTQFFTVSGGIQKWKVPKTGLYRIEAIGCSAHQSSHFAANVLVELQLAKGDTLDILCGQRAACYSGGASFVASANLGLICVSAGAGFGSDTGKGSVALSIDAPGNGQGGTGAGEATNSGSTGAQGQGGAGWLGNGGGQETLGALNPVRLGPSATSNRAVGGLSLPQSSAYRNGGFGGAGGGGDAAYRNAVGGGGGYTGGSGTVASRASEASAFPLHYSSAGTNYAIALSAAVTKRTVSRVNTYTTGYVKITSLD